MWRQVRIADSNHAGTPLRATHYSSPPPFALTTVSAILNGKLSKAIPKA